MATDTRNPTSDLSITGTWTGTAGSRFAAVDDYPDTVGTDTIACSAAGVAIFAFSTPFAIPAGSTAISVQVLYYDSKAGTQTSACGALIRCNDTTNRLASSHNPANATITQRTDNWATNPKSTTAWTVADVNGSGTNALTAFGLSVTDASPAVTLTSIQLQVTYTPPPVLTLAMTATDPTDTLTSSVTLGAAPITLALSVTDSPDTLTAQASTIDRLVLTATDASDTLAAAVGANLRLSFELTDATDTLAAQLTLTSGPTLALSATDPPDAFVATANVVWPLLTTALTATDTRDTLIAQLTSVWPTITSALLSRESLDTLALDVALSGSITGKGGGVANIPSMTNENLMAGASISIGDE